MATLLGHWVAADVALGSFATVLPDRSPLANAATVVPSQIDASSPWRAQGNGCHGQFVFPTAGQHTGPVTPPVATTVVGAYPPDRPEYTVADFTVCCAFELGPQFGSLFTGLFCHSPGSGVARKLVVGVKLTGGTGQSAVHVGDATTTATLLSSAPWPDPVVPMGSPTWPGGPSAALRSGVYAIAVTRQGGTFRFFYKGAVYRVDTRQPIDPATGTPVAVAPAILNGTASSAIQPGEIAAPLGLFTGGENNAFGGVVTGAWLQFYDGALPPGEVLALLDTLYPSCGRATGGGLTAIAGCALVTLAPEPCPPTWPPDPPGLTLEALEIRAAMTAALRGPPRTDPPFTAPAQWTSRGNVMPVRANEAPTGMRVSFQGQLYVMYSGQAPHVDGTGPVSMYWNVGAIARTADGVAWTTVWDGATGPTAPPFPGAPYWQPLMLWVQGDRLFAVVAAAGWSWIGPAAYLAPGEIAVMSTTNGTLWLKGQTLVSWAGAGAGENTGGVASGVSTSGGPTAWRAGGADWLVVGYYVFCNAAAGAVLHKGTPLYRSLDGGATWTLIRDMKGIYPFTSNPDAVEAPHGMVGVPRPGEANDRWVMLGGSGFVNYSDDLGATWTASAAPGGLMPAVAHSLPSGGMLFLIPGSLTGGPQEDISCDYGASRVPISTSGFSGGANTMVSVLQFGAGTAGGEELLAVTKRSGSTAAVVWHTTNGGETWAERGDVPTGAPLPYSLGRIGAGRLVLYLSGGGGAATEVWTCDDAPTGVPTPRTICPFVVSIFPPMGRIAGCASLTFVTELCGALGAPPLGPGLDTCEAPLGLFVLGETCLGAPGLVPLQSTRARSLPHAR